MIKIITLLNLILMQPSVDTLTQTRISKRATITINARIEKTFPLFGPVRESEWADGWDPQILFADTEFEEHTIFRTPAGFEDENHYTWILSKLDHVKHLVEYTVSSVDRVWFITVQCVSNGDKTFVTVTYTYTGFTNEACEKNRSSLSKMYLENLKDWETAINHYLLTGKKLTH